MFGWEYPEESVEFLVYLTVTLDELYLLVIGSALSRVVDWILIVPAIWKYMVFPLETYFGIEDPLARWTEVDYD